MKKHLSVSECYDKNPDILQELDAIGVELLRTHVPDHVLRTALTRIVRPLVEDPKHAQHIKNLFF